MTVTPSPMLCACDHQEHYFSLRRASLLDSGVTTGFYNPVAFFTNGLGGQRAEASLPSEVPSPVS